MVGEIEATLIDLGLADNTLVVFTSDNGPLLENHADLPTVYGKYGTVNEERKHLLRGAKGSIWEGGLREPCLMKWPGRIQAGAVCDEVIAGFDLYTTFAKIAGVDIPKDRIIDGKDITPLMFGQAGAKSPHENFYYYRGYTLGAVRQGQWKLLVAPPGGLGTRAAKGEFKPKLFDLAADISESKDVAAENPEIVGRLLAVVQAARADLGDASHNMTGKNRRPPDTAE
jgi:arylsulfatase A-like enzyme